MVSLLRKTLILLYQNPTLRTSFNLNYLLRGTISKYSHIEGWVFPHMNFGGDTFSPSNKFDSGSKEQALNISLCSSFLSLTHHH